MKLDGDTPCKRPFHGKHHTGKAITSAETLGEQLMLQCENNLSDFMQETDIRNTQILKLASNSLDIYAAPFRGSHSPEEELHETESCCKHPTSSPRRWVPSC